ncbi:MAG: hypothetical protein GXP31_09020 [Kiritimatiellaeota bacterium]|nr:hypothetical protein [Kiritimatiellota bacterium]
MKHPRNSVVSDRRWPNAPVRGRAFLLAAFVLLRAAAAPGPAAAVLLDFGKNDSPLQKGFARLTPTSVFKPGVRAGWVRPTGLRAEADPIRREGTYSASRGRTEPPPIYLTELSCDRVESDAAAVLRVTLPPGNYRMWVLLGPGGGNRAQVWDAAVDVAGSTLTATLAGPWDSRVRRHAFSNPADQLDIRFDTRSRWAVSALAIASEKAWPAIEKDFIKPAEQAIFLLPPELLAKWKVRPRVKPDPQPQFTDAEKKRGFVLYHRHWSQPIWPTSAPRRSEIDPTLKAFAAPDEYEPLTLSVYPLRPETLERVTVTDLVAAGSGSRVPADQVDVRWVRTMAVRPNYRVVGAYYRAPDVLMPWRGPRTLVPNESLRLWLTLHVGPAVPDDVYRGEIRLTFAGGAATRTPVVFRVAGIKLEKDRSLVYGAYYHHPFNRMFAAPDAFSRQWWRRKAELEHADMAAHGNNTLVLGLGGHSVGGGKWRFDFDRLGQMIDLYRRVGFYQPIICHFPVGSLYRKYMKSSPGSHLRLVKMPPKPFFDELTAMVRDIETERRRRQWPELLYYPIDEPATTEVAVNFMTQVMKAIKRVPGVRTYVTADPANDAFSPMRPYVNVWCCQPFSLARDTVIADMKKRPVEYWCYPNHVAGENDHTPVAGARMTYGFGFWRSGFRALTPWIYQAVIGNPWNYLDGGAMDFFNRTDDDGSPIPVTLWEAYREGIDDGRYLATLDRWIDRARAAGKTDAVREAQADRRLLWEAIPVMPKYKYEVDWTPETFDVFRWLLAQRILKLKAALGQ